MNAQEARSKATTFNSDLVDKEYRSIKNRITVAVTNGAYEVWVYSDIRQPVKDKLRDEGYIVGNCVTDPRNEQSIQIKW